MAVHSDRNKRDDRCTCPAHAAQNRALHHPSCVGHHKTGWRARMPEFLLPEVEAIEDGVPRGLPVDVYRDLTMEYAHRARFGTTATSPASPEPVLVEIPATPISAQVAAQIPNQRQARA